MCSKTLIIILVVALSVVLGISGILLGLILGNHKQDAAPQNTASASSDVQITTQQTTTETTAVSETSATVSEAETTTVTTVTTAPKPVITKAYLYYFNTGAGVKLYLHAEGNFASYQYQLYFKMPGEPEYSDAGLYGENSVEEFLVAEGLGGYGIESYKADLTAWNQDKSQSVQQWAYVDLAKSSHPVDQPMENYDPGVSPGCDSDELVALYDADEDGSPELLAYSTKYGAEALSLYYDLISSAGNMEAANCNYKIPQTNEILAYRETSTFRKYTVYYLDGEFQIKTRFAVDTSGGQPAYFANGESITKEAYQKIAAPYDTSRLDTIPWYFVDEITGSDSRSVSEIPSEKRLNAADMDQDGILTMIDVTRILQYILE